MAAHRLLHAEPTVLRETEKVLLSGSCGAKAFGFLSLIVSMSYVARWVGSDVQYVAVQDPAIIMSARYTQPTSRAVLQAKMYGIGNTPLEKLAITAIHTVNRCSQVRDMSMNAESFEPGTPAEFPLGDQMSQALDKNLQSDMTEAVALKAQDMAGITAPMDLFDPLGFSTDIPAGKLRFYREVELKHGRICMLASLGILVAENFHPLFGGKIDVPAYVAFQQTPLQQFWFAVVFAIAIPEMFSVFTFDQLPGTNPRAPNTGAWWSIRADHDAGNLGFDPLGLKPTDPKEYREMQNKELNNGRLAMIAAAGMIAQEVATGKKLFG
jgi:hypothetical protein